MLKKIALVSGVALGMLFSINFSALANPIRSELFQNQKYKKALISYRNNSILKECGINIKCTAKFLRAHHITLQAAFFWRHFSGYVNEIKNYGPVAVIHAQVWAADHSDNYFLINNDGLIVDVSDYDLINSHPITNQSSYKQIIAKYPNAFLNPIAQGFPQVKTSDHGQSFIFQYRLVNGCMACALVANIPIAFKFDAKGNFMGVELQPLKE